MEPINSWNKILGWENKKTPKENKVRIKSTEASKEPLQSHNWKPIEKELQKIITKISNVISPYFESKKPVPDFKKIVRTTYNHLARMRASGWKNNSYVVDPDLFKVEKLDETNKKELSKKALEIMGEDVEIRPLIAGKKGAEIEVNGYAQKGDGFIEGTITPTYLRNASPDTSNRLMNLYLTKLNGEEMPIIRSGVIDSPEKAKAFFDMALKANGDRRPIRILSSQLNSWEKEASLVKNQMRYLKEEAERRGLSENFVYLNKPTNRWYYLTKQLGKVSELMLQGEKKAKQFNGVGLKTYASWLFDDLGIDKPKNLKEMLQILKAKKSSLETMAHPFENQKEALEKITLMIRLIEGHQSRMDEHMMIKRLNNLMNVVSCTNCKSGIDRCVVVWSLDVAQRQFEALFGPERLKNLVDRFGELSLMLNRGENLNDQAIQDLQLFRTLILDLYIKVGLPISGASTGVEGLKWGKGFEENFHPLQVLPSTVESDGEILKLVNYDKKGRPIGMTREGRNLLSKLSHARGT